MSSSSIVAPAGATAMRLLLIYVLRVVLRNGPCLDVQKYPNRK